MSERLQSVTYSFGTREEDDGDGSGSAWFHILYKNINVNADGRIADPRDGGTTLSQADWTWNRSSYFLHWTNSSPRQASPEVTGVVHDTSASEVTLLCFGTPETVQARFARISQHPSSLSSSYSSLSTWRSALGDPYLLFATVLEEISVHQDKIIWDFSRVFGKVERATLDQAQGVDRGEQEHDFVGLHNMAKHIIYLKESSDATINILGALDEAHDMLLSPSGAASLGAQVARIHQSTRLALQYRRRFLESQNLRLTSLEKRMANVINLVS
ncbi:MAG: hypothetical protein M1819_002640 [Sarea resinae]|nr:MAG: hypothetical protein M1819_002640 [Sarea resinae]